MSTHFASARRFRFDFNSPVTITHLAQGSQPPLHFYPELSHPFHRNYVILINLSRYFNSTFLHQSNPTCVNYLS